MNPNSMGIPDFSDHRNIAGNCGLSNPREIPKPQRWPRWLDRAEMMVPPVPWDQPRWRNNGGPPVVLLHGLWRGWRAMEPMARALRQSGFSTLNVPYPSACRPVPELAEIVRRYVLRIGSERPIHFVTHSLGGIVARALLATPPPWPLGRLVMLAPPNRGSEIVDWSRDHPVLRRLLGPAGRSLGSDGFPGALPPLPENLETAVIMGRRSLIRGFTHLLEEENDGIVSVSRGRIDGLRGFSVIDADHTFMPMHPDAIQLTTDFLINGTWPLSSESG